MTASLPQIILFSHDLQDLQNCGNESGAGEAHLIDIKNGSPEVVHLNPFAKPGDTRGRQVLPLKWYLNGGQMPESTAARTDPGVMLWIDTHANPAVARCNLHLDEARLLGHPVDIIQTGSVAFTRNAPILESPALNEASVLCIGLGSGGSIVADQLARAGVGRFILWDMDRLEAHNIGRHLCTSRDLGRRKVLAVKDHIKAVNPVAEVKCIDKDVVQAPDQSDELESEILAADCVIVGTDNNRSRFAINEAAWHLRKVALYGRAFKRAAGGDVIQAIPGQTPCYACHVGTRVVEEEISSARDVDRVAYADTVVAIEPGLNVDIHPIANMIARLALLRLCENTESSLRKVAEETRAPLYLWANRREEQFSSWQPMERSYDRLAILRWYAVSVHGNKECMTCGFSQT